MSWRPREGGGLRLRFKRLITARRWWLMLLGIGCLLTAAGSSFTDQRELALGLGAVGGVLTALVASRLERHTVPGPPAGGAPPKVWALPQRLAHFTGRRESLDELEEVLNKGRHPDIAVLCGIGAAGKTSIALEYAHRVHQRRTFTAWIPASERASVLASLAEMGRALGVANEDQEEAARSALHELQSRSRFLIVYDGATPDSVRGLLPVAGDGDVLITSRSERWDHVGAHIQVQPLGPSDANDLLIKLSGDQSRDARRQAIVLAQRLGYLPLALYLAGKYCRGHMTLAQFNALLTQRSQVTLQYGHELVARLSVARVAKRSPAAVQLLRLLSYLAAGYSPQALVTGNEACLPRDLKLAVRDPDRWRETVDVLQDAGLIRAETGRFWVHQAVQEVERAGIGLRTGTGWRRLWHGSWRLVGRSERTVSWTQERWLELAVSLLLSEFPAHGTETARWDTFAYLLPHATAVLGELKDSSPAALPEARLSGLVAGYLLEGRNLGSAKALLERVVEVRKRVQGYEHVDTVNSLHSLAMVYRGLGELILAHDTHGRVLEIRQRVLGRDHEETLISKSCLALVKEEIGDSVPAKVLREEVEQTRARLAARGASSDGFAGVRAELYGAQDALRRDWELRERVLGPGHPDTLISMVNLAEVTRALGETAVAHDLLESAFEVAGNLLGPDDPLTLLTLSDLADVLWELGELQGARERYQELLGRLQQLFGREHAESLRAMFNLADVLLRMDMLDEAQDLSTRVFQARVQGARHEEIAESAQQLMRIEQARGR